MKEFNKILYDILLKIELNKDQKLFKINKNLINKYFNTLNDIKSVEYLAFESYLLSFYHFCFELSLENMVRDAIKFKN